MRLDSGSHPHLYKVGMRLAKTSPKLWDAGLYALSVPDRITNAVSNRTRPKTDGGPIKSVNLELSILCNLRCPFCWWWGENGIGFKLTKERDPMVTQELSTEQLKAVIDQLAKDRPSFYLSGGEPFIRRDTVDLIEYICGKGMSVITNNNGTVLTDEKLQRLAKIKNLTINFSIDGPREVHDRIRGKGMYDKTTSTIKRLVQLRGNSLFPAIKTNTTFSPWIQGTMDGLIRELQEDVGVDATRLQHLWFTNRDHAEAHKKELNRVFGTNEAAGVDSHIISTPDRDYVDKLAKEILTIEKTKYRKPVFIHPRMTHEQIVRYYSDLNWTLRDRCYIAWGSVLIKANGDVMFCPDEWMTDFKLGNVKTENIHDMWKNEKAKKFRTELWGHGLFPACTRCCVING